MREVIRGSRADNVLPSRPSVSLDAPGRPSLSLNSPTSASEERQPRPTESEALEIAVTEESQHDTAHLSPHHSTAASPSPGPLRHVAFRADSNDPPVSPRPLASNRRRSSSFFRNNEEDRPEEDVYYDSRAATRREWKRRATTLQDYYKDNPELLPQLPFTWHRGKKRWRLIGLIVLMWIDACAIPIILYYGLTFGGNIQGWITFAVVTTIWGGPTYLEFGVRTLKLMKKERFYRPLGTNYRWCFDYLEIVSATAIALVTGLFIIGSAPHIVWLRVLCMPMPALLYCLGFFVAYPTLYHKMGWPARHRISSTAKGESVRPGIYYIVEDMVAVNSNAGRPYREAISARYEASPRFRQMMYRESIFWSVPAIAIAIPLTIIAVIHPVPASVAYGICWAVPFIWATIWGLVSMKRCKQALVNEREEWETTKGPIRINEVSLDTEAPSSTLPVHAQPEKELQERTLEQTV